MIGNGSYYRLGHGNDNNYHTPTIIMDLQGTGQYHSDGTCDGVSMVACGRWHTIVVAQSTNEVYGLSLIHI